jgi:glucokinase
MMPSSVISVYNFSPKKKAHVPMTCIDFFFSFEYVRILMKFDQSSIVVDFVAGILI